MALLALRAVVAPSNAGRSALGACRIVGGRRFKHARAVSPGSTANIPLSTIPATSTSLDISRSPRRGWAVLERSWSLASRYSTSALASSAASPGPVHSPGITPATSTLPATQIETSLIHLNDILENEIGIEGVWPQRLEDAQRRLYGRKGKEGCSIAGEGGASTALLSMHLLENVQLPAHVLFATSSATTVYGPPSSSAPSQLVTSLLTEPLAEDERTRTAIASRHARDTSTVESAGQEIDGSGEGAFVTRFGSILQAGQRGLVCDSPWLREAGYEVREIRSSITEQILSDLLASDIPILVVDPLRLLDTPELRRILPALVDKPNLQIIVNGRLSHAQVNPEGSSERIAKARADLSTVIRSQIAAAREINRVAPSVTPLPNVTLSFVDSCAALSAMSSLRASLSLSSTAKEEAFRAFQTLYTESNLDVVGQQLLGDVRASHRKAETGELRDESVRYVRGLAAREARAVLDKLRAEADAVEDTISSLRYETDALKTRLSDVSFTRHVTISAELEKARRAVEQVLRERLTWWKVVGWRVDMVGEEIGQEVQGRWGHGLAQQLSFESGKLEAARGSLSTRINTLLEAYKRPDGSASPSPFYSAILQNRLEQVESTTAISPTSLLSPLDRRRSQLLQYSIPALHKRGHQITWTMYPLIFLTTSLSWSATVPLELLSQATGTGIGLLSGLAIVRWATGRWKRAEKLFWRDWDRVSEGLEHDLQAEWKDLVNAKVAATSEAAVQGLGTLLRARTQRLDIWKTRSVG